MIYRIENLNFSAVFNPIVFGCSRAELFSILAEKTTHAPLKKCDWVLPPTDKNIGRQLDVSSEPYEVTRLNYIEWVNASLVRDLIENLYATFEAINRFCLFGEAAKNSKELSKSEYEKLLQSCNEFSRGPVDS